MKKALIFLIALTLLLSQFACAQPPASVDDEATNQTPKPKYSVQIYLSSYENLIFSRYDIDIYIDDSKVGTLDHGMTSSYQLDLDEGSHTLLLTKENERDVDGAIQFSVSEDMELNYKLSCTHDQVEIEEVSEQESASAEESASSEESASADIDSAESVPGIEVKLEEVFPVEYAKRTVVVVMTTSLATDVFKADGNTYDTALFHSYSDTSSFYLTIISEGDWYAKNSNTWHVDDIELKIEGYGSYLRASMDIIYDGTNYVVPDFTRVIAAREYLYSDDPSKINIEQMEPSENTPFLTVDFSLIKDDRIMN